MNAALVQPQTSRAAAPARRPLTRTSPALVLVANPHASGLAKRAELVDGAARELRALGGSVELRLTETLDELAAVLTGEERRIVLLGGDGSVHAAANVPGRKPELALLPAGKANNLAHGLGVPVELRDAARLALSGAARPIDAIVAESAERRYLALEGVSVGFHAQARAGYTAENSADVRAALATGARALASYAPIQVGISSDGRSELIAVSQLFVSNFPLFAFGLRVAPSADPADGLLDVTTIGPRGRLAFLATLKHLRAGTHVGRRGNRHWQARRIRIAPGGRSPVIADTTNLGSGTVDLSVAHGALELVTP